MPIFRFLKPMFSLLRQACLLHNTWKTVFSRYILAMYEIGIEEVTRGIGDYKELQRVTRGYKGLQGVTRGYKGLQGVTRGDRG